MSTLLRKNLDEPDETREFDAGMGHLDVVNTDGGAVGRAVFEPGWRWSEHVKPIAGTASCEAAHTGYVISGAMKVVMDDGQEAEFGPSDFMIIPPGHDAWTIGTEACVIIDWQGYADYAKASATAGTVRS
ncbi:MAG TPA: cupin domain-containing protein [Acidimicrobiales bacterium]